MEKSIKLLGSNETGAINSKGVSIKLFKGSDVSTGLKKERLDSTGVLLAKISPVKAKSAKIFKGILFFIGFTFV